MRGKATLLSTHIVNPNRTRVQIIRPRPGETRKLPLDFAASGISAAIVASELHRPREEEGDQAEDERVERDGLGQRESEPADRLQLVLHLGLAGHGLDLLAEDEADADAGPDRPETGPDAQRDRLAGVLDRREVGGLGQGNQEVSH